MAGKRTRNAKGSICKGKRARGEHVWYFRYKDKDEKYRAIEIGTVKDFPTKSHARNEADRQKLVEKHINPIKELRAGRRTFGQLIDAYKSESIPERWSTKHSYESWLGKHIEPQWKDFLIEEIEPAAVELWLRQLKLASKSKGHIKGLMVILFDEAMKRKLIPIERNPMDLVTVRGGTKRKQRPNTLSPEQIQTLISSIGEQYIQMVVIISMCLGLRFSEVLALKWSDIDWKNLGILVCRGIVNGRVGPVKTEYSEEAAPLDPDLAELLLDWRKVAPFIGDDHWLFASPFTAGQAPYFPTAVRRKIHAAAKAAGIADKLRDQPTKILRHSYRAWLGVSGAPLAVIKDLMRHADVRTTMNVYGNGMQPEMREANSRVVKLVLKK